MGFSKEDLDTNVSTFDEYQKKSQLTDTGTEAGTHFVYLTMGLAGEAGELTNKVKKIFRDDDGKITEQRKNDIKKELGDTLWYLSQLATAFDFELKDIAKDNLDKLFSRFERGTVLGDGDNR